MRASPNRRDLAKLTANEVKRLHEALSTSKILGTKVLAADGLWRFFAPCHECLFRRVPKIFSQRFAEYFWTREPGIVR
jgi:hypothetical protein